MALVAGVFGALSVMSGSAVLSGGAIGRAAGEFVPFVVWFNLLGGFAYLAGAIGIALWRPWALPVAAAIALATLLVFAAFGVHVLRGGAFEPRTVAAMTLRLALWAGIAVALRRRIGRRRD